MTTDGKTMAGFFPATAMPDSDWWNILWPEPAQVVAKLGVKPGMDVVDLCCGDGLFTAPMAQIARRVLAIDIDPQMLDLARARVAAAGATNCAFVLGDAYEIAALVPWLADLVLIANTFHGVPDKARLAHGVAAILKPKGRLVVVNWHRRPREETPVLGQPRGPKTEMRIEPEDVATAVAPSGLRLERVVELPPYHYGAIFVNASTSSTQNNGKAS
ncbi:MAG: methyltransferase domain-containing protein [Acidobacteriia bacterium]|nr:methyltransferase domain-containing protein [Methyloceanibacter sp.]MCL6491195.1 methyltransferase domain-containing protein [Terriglobia bacterium]